MRPEEEAQLLKQDMKACVFDWVEIFPLLFRDGDQAGREMNRIKRHAKSHLHRAIELERGEA